MPDDGLDHQSGVILDDIVGVDDILLNATLVPDANEINEIAHDEAAFPGLPSRPDPGGVPELWVWWKERIMNSYIGLALSRRPC